MFIVVGARFARKLRFNLNSLQMNAHTKIVFKGSCVNGDPVNVMINVEKEILLTDRCDD